MTSADKITELMRKDPEGAGEEFYKNWTLRLKRILELSSVSK